MSRWSISSSSTTRISPSTRTSPRRCGWPACPQAEIDARVEQARPISCVWRRCSTGGPPSCPAASSSAPPSPARSSRTPTSSCSTSRSPISTTSCARSCATSCRKLFAGRHCIVVYATTEPIEALLFGGNTATLHEGRVTQFGPTAEIYRQPADLITAQVFSDPPINTAPVTKQGGEILIGDSIRLPRRQGRRSDPRRPYTIGIRPHHITPTARRRRRARSRGPGAGHRAQRLGERRPFRPQRPHLGVAVARRPPLRGRDRPPGSMSMSTRASSSTTMAGSLREAA